MATKGFKSMPSSGVPCSAPRMKKAVGGLLRAEKPAGKTTRSLAFKKGGRAKK